MEKVPQVSKVAQVPQEHKARGTLDTLATRATSAFTLIEILVGLTIIALLFSFGFVSFRDFTRRQALSSAAKTLQGDLRLTQANALSGVKPISPFCASPNRLNSYNFTVVNSGQYRIEAVCSGGVVVSKTVTLANGITISTPSTNPMAFKVLGQGNNIPSGTSVTITVAQANTSDTVNVVVTSGGEIR